MVRVKEMNFPKAIGRNNPLLSYCMTKGPSFRSFHTSHTAGGIIPQQYEAYAPLQQGAAKIHSINSGHALLIVPFDRLLAH